MLQKLDLYLWETESPPFELYEAHWISGKSLIAMRFTFFLFTGFVFLWEFVGSNWLVPLEFMTNWGIVLSFVYFSLIVSSYLIYQDNNNKDLRKPFSLWKVTHIMFEVTFSLQILIPIFYWCVLYPISPTPISSYPGFEKDLCQHLFTGLTIWLEFAFNKMRFYKRHSLCLGVLSLLYCLINFLVTISNGPVYPVITWKSISSYLYLILAFSIAFVGFYFGYILSNRKLNKTKKNSLLPQ